MLPGRARKALEREREMQKKGIELTNGFIIAGDCMHSVWVDTLNYP